MEAEKIKKALELCSKIAFCSNECPYYESGSCIRKVTGNALALITEQEQRIKEFTEENEKLRADIAKEFTCVFGQPHKVTNCPIDDEIAKAKADTVREIFDLVECAFSPALVYEGQTIKRYIAELEKKYAAGGAKMDGERNKK